MAVPSPDSNLSTLTQIRIKVRKLTRSPSTSQLSDTDIDAHINNFVLYDFPRHLNLFTLRKTLSFYTKPYIDVYENNTTLTTDPLYNFINKYSHVYSPIYISGSRTSYSQSIDEFFSSHSKLSYKVDTGHTGNAVTTTFAGTLSSNPILQNNVSFTSIGADSVGLIAIDVPIKDGVTGYNTMTGNLVVPGTDTSIGTINYVSGVYSVTFPTAPALDQKIYSNTIPFTAGKPTSVLYFDNKFTLRPVPDVSYRVDLVVQERPAEFLATATTKAPELSEWWQYIAYGTAKKVFEDRMDMESISNIMSEFKQQELLVLRKSIIQQSNQRTATIYTGHSNQDFYNSEGN